MSSQPVNVTVVNRGCGSGCSQGCGFVLLLVLLLPLVGVFFRYWYVTVPIAAVVLLVALVGARSARQRSAGPTAAAPLDVDSTEVHRGAGGQSPPTLPAPPDASTIVPPPPIDLHMVPPPVVEPGWKRDPSDPSHIAYWDGMQYTAHKRWDGSAWVDS